MATAVLDLDLLQLPVEISGLENYNKAYVLVRLGRIPVAKTYFMVNKGCINTEELVKTILNQANTNLYGPLLKSYFHPETLTKNNLRKATIAVCTRDRPEDLRRCLDALMQLPDMGQEYIVIDNCPTTDKTKILVSKYPKVRYFLEERPGLNFARNTALHKASNEIVAFTDDDAMPDPEWLQSILPNFQDPLVLCVNGLTMPIELETPAQEWFEKHSSFCKGFKWTVFQDGTHKPLAPGQIGAGANMAIRKSALQLLGPFDEALDAGTLTRSGGDHEYFIRILLAGYKIIYEPKAVSWHRHKRTWKELLTVIFGYGVGVYATWTRYLLTAGEWGVLYLAFGWFRHQQLPLLMKSIINKPGSTPLAIILAELKGCAFGPWAYLISRRKIQRKLK